MLREWLRETVKNLNYKVPEDDKGNLDGTAMVPLYLVIGAVIDGLIGVFIMLSGWKFDFQVFAVMVMILITIVVFFFFHVWLDNYVRYRR